MEKKDLIIALHGFLGQARDWDYKLKKPIPFECTVIAPSFFVNSEWGPHKNLEEWGEFFLTQCEKWVENGFKLNLFAYSLGGRLALGPFLKKPELFAEAHFFSVNPGLKTSNELELRKISDENWAAQFRNDPWDLVIKKWNSQKVFLNDFEPERKENDFDRELLALALINWSLSQQKNYTEMLITLKSKINWWVGEKDSKFVKIGNELATHNANIKLNIVPKLGHRLIFS